MSRKNQNKLVLGDYNAICDVCKWKFKASDLRRRWDNLMVCEKDWEPRHPQDFIRAIPDMQALPWTRPETGNDFVSTSFNTLSGEENPTATQVGPDRAPYYDTFQSFDTPVPTLTATPSVDSYILQVNYGTTYTKNVFEEKITINGAILLRSSGGSTSGTANLDLSSYTSSAVVTIMYTIEDINGVFHSVSIDVDPYFGFVKLLVHADTDYTDSSLIGTPIIQTGSQQSISTANPLYGAGSILSTDVTYGPHLATALNSVYTPGQQFTIEFALYQNSEHTAAFPIYFGLYTDTGTDGGIRENASNHKLEWSGVFATAISLGTMQLGSWVRYAVTRDSSNVVRTFQNGTLIQEVTDTGSFTGNTPIIQIAGQSGSYSVDGYMDEIRYTKDICRYTADYDVATAAFPDK